MWTPSPLLVPVEDRQEQIDEAFLAARQHLLGAFPGAQVSHVGSTSLAPALSRGIVDIELRVAAGTITEALERLSASDALPDLKMKVAVHVGDWSAPSDRLRIRQTLAENPLLLGEFIGLQKQHAHRLGKPYPAAKARFFASLLHSPELAATVDDMLPYRIEVETDRLRLVSALAIDAEDFARYRQDNREYHEKFAGKRPDSHYGTELWKKRFAEGAIQRWRKESLTLLLRDKEEGKLLGACNFSGFVWGAFRTCHIGYQLGQEHEGKGYMSEAATAAMDYLCTEWGVHRVQAVYDVDNARSAKLANRLGLSIEGKAKDYIFMDGSWHDGVLTSVTR